MKGEKFNRLTVLEELPNYKVRCECDCGQTTVVNRYKVIKGHTQSCGCQRAEKSRERAINRNTTHGDGAPSGERVPEYRAWEAMKYRCLNLNATAYPDYGGRGITVCERWMSYENFIADMGRKPSPDHQLDRIDNDGPYSPDNCRWATRDQQQRNTRTSRTIRFRKQTKHLNEWAEQYGLEPATLRDRLNSGWSMKKALTTPAVIGSNQWKIRTPCI